MPGRSGLAGSAGVVPDVLQLCVAPRQLTPGFARCRSDPLQAFGPEMAAVHTGDGGGLDRPCVVTQRDRALPGATVAASSSAVTGWPGRGACIEAGSVCLQTGQEV